MATKLIALDSIICGSEVVERGEVVPESYVDLFGAEQPVDGDRLVELGVAAPERSKEARAAKAEPADEPEPEPEGRDPRRSED